MIDPYTLSGNYYNVSDIYRQDPHFNLNKIKCSFLSKS